MVDVSEWQVWSPFTCRLTLTHTSKDQQCVVCTILIVHPCPSDCCRFDIIGLAAFSTDFKSLDGEKSAVATALTAVGHAKPSPTAAKILLLAQAFPILLKLPLPRSTLVADLSNAMDAVVDRLTDAAQSGKIGNENLGSVLGVLRERVYYEQQT